MSRDHFVPKLLLKRFQDEDGRLWYYDTKRAHKGVEPRNPDSVFYKKYFSSNSDRTFTVERQFNERVETPFNEFLDELLPKLEPAVTFELTGDQRALCAAFTYYQAKRRPELMTDLLNDEYGSFEDPDEKRAMEFTRALSESSDVVDKGDLHDMRLSVLTHTNSEVLSGMSRAGIWFLESHRSERFCVTSNPVKSHNLHVLDKYGNEMSGTSLAMPVSKDFAMCFGPPSLDGTVQRIATKEVAEKFNSTLWRTSNKIAGTSKAQLERLVQHES
jgi:hypothetical protein